METAVKHLWIPLDRLLHTESMDAWAREDQVLKRLGRGPPQMFRFDVGFVESGHTTRHLSTGPLFRPLRDAQHKVARCFNIGRYSRNDA